MAARRANAGGSHGSWQTSRPYARRGSPIIHLPHSCTRPVVNRAALPAAAAALRVCTTFARCWLLRDGRPSARSFQTHSRPHGLHDPGPSPGHTSRPPASRRTSIYTILFAIILGARAAGAGGSKVRGQAVHDGRGTRRVRHTRRTKRPDRRQVDTSMTSAALDATI